MNLNSTYPNLTVYIGHDPREQEAYDVCHFSLRYSGFTGKIVKLSSKDIPEFTREREPNQATDFTYTRFLVPYLNNYEGYALFVDCDFLFLNSPGWIFKDIHQEFAVACCKHPQYIPNSDIKMDGVPQSPMWRKNWASLMMFNCAHEVNKLLTPEYVNIIMPGKLLHQFCWVPERYLASIPLEWNCLDDYYHFSEPSAIHYTDGGPWLPLTDPRTTHYHDTRYANVWKYYRDLMKDVAC